MTKTFHRLTILALLVPALLLPASFRAMAGSSDVRFRHYTVRQGISDTFVTSLAQDKQGLIWIGTKHGLNCFNGISFKVFLHNPSDDGTIAGNSVQCLHVAGDGKIWVGLTGGLVSCYDPALESFTNYLCYFSEEETDGDVSAIADDASGNIWITVDRRGLVRLNPGTGNLIRYEHSPENPSSLSHNAVTDIEKDSNGKMWITSWGGGLDLFDPETGTFTNYPYPGTRDQRFRQLKCIFRDTEGNLWLGSTYLGAFFFGTENDKWVQYYDGLTGDSVTAIAQDADANIWIGLANGLDIFHPSDGTVSQVGAYEGDFGLQSQEITCMMRDRDGSMWVGTTGGLHMYNPGMIQFSGINMPGGKPLQEYTRYILKDTEGDLWVRTEDPVSVYGSKGEKTVLKKTFPDSRLSTIGNCIFEDSASNIWMGTSGNNVLVYNRRTGKMRNLPLPSTLRNVNNVYEEADGTLWLSSELGLVSYDPSSQSFGQPLYAAGDLIFPSDKTTSVLRDRYGDLWAGTQGGLKRFSPDGILKKIYKVSDGSLLSDNDITSLCEDCMGTLWVGTASGLDRYDREKDAFSLVKMSGEQVGFPVMGILEDSRGILWVTSSSGLIMYDPESQALHLFDEADGLPGRVFVKNALSLARDGEILAGTVNGAVRFRPENIVIRSNPPTAYIEDFQIFSTHVVPGQAGSVLDRTVRMTDKVELNYKQSTLTFQFAATDFLSPGKVRFAYRMVGIDDQWLYTDYANCTATYANLSPGKYAFEVKASDGMGRWEGETARLEMEIHPPFYRTPWAYALYLLLFIAVTVEAGLWLRRRSNRKMERLLAAQQHEMDELKLQFFTNISHEFRTSLTLILGPMEYMMKHGQGGQLMDIMHRSAERLRRLVNQLLDFRKVEAGKMEVHNTSQDMVRFLKDLFNTFGYYAGEKKLDYVFNTSVDSLVMSFDRDKVDKVVYNLLSNAFKYTDNGGQVTLDFSVKENGDGKFACIVVKDNGVGISQEEMQQLFKRFYQASGNRNSTGGGSGLGLNMTHELVMLMGGDISVESEPGKGSVFTVHLPCIEAEDASQDFVPQPVYQPAEEEIPVAPAERKKELILVVEDNSDMRAYIRTVIGDEYLIVTAANGEEGLEKAVETMPDIIISDVMMPKMDGKEMFRRIKDDERISHIPVILLTAIQEEQSVADSLKMGIDDYVTKPFKPAILLARISNVLKRRQKMWEEKTYDTNPFVVKITDIIRERIQDPSLSLEYLSGQLNMSPTQLTRKTKSLMDITPYSLIIKLRMEQAVRFLKETDYNISEIAYQCGYQEISNFSRAFTRYWGESPSQSLKKYR